MTEPILLSAKQVAAILGMTTRGARNHLHRAEAEGQLARIMFGTKTSRWRKEDIDRWIASRTVTDPRRAAAPLSVPERPQERLSLRRRRVPAPAQLQGAARGGEG